MKTKNIILAFSIFLLFQGCNKSQKDFISDFSKYNKFIVAFTQGIISAGSDIRVVLATDNFNWSPNQVLDDDLFDISPSVSGKVVALSSNTIAFIPDEKLDAGTEYRVTLNLDEINPEVKNTEEKLDKFNFIVKTVKQNFNIEVGDIQSNSADTQYINCTMKLADKIDVETAQKLIEAEQFGDDVPVVFEKVAGEQREFQFKIDNIKRKGKESSVKIIYDGDELDIDKEGEIEVPITAVKEFKVIKAETEGESRESLIINFSEPLKKAQNFKGLVSVENLDNLKYSAQGNVLKVFFDKSKGIPTTDLLLEIFQGIESQYGNALKGNYSQKIIFEEIKPSIRFVKNGTIMPSSSNLKLNFEAVNLSAVDVRVLKIYKNNMLQFLQYNELNGRSQLKKMAQPVAKTTIQLNENNLFTTSQWNTYALDLAKIITPEPGTIYRVELSYKKAYNLYKCTASEENSDEQKKDEEEVEEIAENDINYSGEQGNSSYYYDNYYDNDYYAYENYGKDSSPCNDYYYRYGTKIGTNILASNIGVIAKRGEDKSYVVAVNNILTTEPIAKAQVELYNYQQQKIESKATNADGVATFKLDKFAYFAIVTYDNQSTYVKLDDGLALSTSNFNVSGEKLQKGLKGYIYGERGVWRPGDDLYLSFILNDAANKLPMGHPIKFRLTDPNGKVTNQMVQKVNELNHYTFIIPTDVDAPTGNWEAMVSVGGAKFYKSIKIETIKPNRLKIKNSFENQVLTSTSSNSIDLEVKWLHGAIAKNLKVEMKAKFISKKTNFKKFESFSFDDLTRSFNTEEISVFEGNLDQNGQVKVTLNPEVQGQAPGMLNAYLITKVYEEGGDFSTDVTSAIYSPYSTYVGIKSPQVNRHGILETDKDNRFDIVTVDEKGNPKSVSNIEVKVYKLSWRWWWSESEENVSNYISDGSTTEVENLKVNTDATGRGYITLNKSEREWGRYLIRAFDEKSGHATSIISTIDWPDWSGKTRNDGGSSASMLVFSTDKDKYTLGEKVKISFPSSEGGHAFISVENGTRVVQTLMVKTKAGETKLELPITSEMAPSVYIHITLLQPHANTKNDSPIRLYGIVPIEVLDQGTILTPKISMPDVLKPEQSFSMQVSEKSGKAMTYTIAVVDEGLLDLTRFATPNAWNSFFVREALGVKTWDIYDDVIGAYGGKINQIFSIGGDQDLGGGKAKKANRFKPVVVFLGPFKLEAGQTKTHQIQLPKYIGSVKTMVVAANSTTSAYGCAEKATPVRSPLMVLASLPRKITPSEKVTVPVTVFAMEKEIKDVTVQIKTSNGINVVKSATQNITFTQPEEKIVNFELEIGSFIGIGKIEIIATSGEEKSSYETEIDVLNPNPVTTTTTNIVLEPNQTQTISWTAFGIRGSNKAAVEISSMPAINLERRLGYLIQYPHGCVEQTTSSVLPQLYLNDLMDLEPERLKVIQNNVTKGIERLSTFQLSNGGISYWPGMNYADDWGTSYAGHFMLEAEKKGYTLPVNFKSNWISYQRTEAKKWRFDEKSGNDFAQAYRLYTLALAGDEVMSAMNRLKETKGISNESKLRLASAYALVGKKSAGLTLVQESKVASTASSRYRHYYYGSENRNIAMALETYILLGQREEALDLAKRLAAAMSNDSEWMSTQTTAYCLFALSRFANGTGTKGIDVKYVDDGKPVAIKTEKTMVGRKLSVKDNTNSITITNNKNNTIFVCIANSGILPVGEEKIVQKNLATSVTFRTKDGAIKVEKISQGTEFMAEIEIKNLKNMDIQNVALTQILPSGFEIVNTRFTDYGDSTTNSPADYIDIRDDRTNFYLNLGPGESKTFRVLLNASYLGRYYMPGIQAEAMYDNNFLSRTKGTWVEISK